LSLSLSLSLFLSLSLSLPPTTVTAPARAPAKRSCGERTARRRTSKVQPSGRRGAKLYRAGIASRVSSTPRFPRADKLACSSLTQRRVRFAGAHSPSLSIRDPKTAAASRLASNAKFTAHPTNRARFYDRVGAPVKLGPGVSRDVLNHDRNEV